MTLADNIVPATPTIVIFGGNSYTSTTQTAITITNDTDNVGVTGWFVSESPSAPACGAAWSSTKPTAATISSGDGTKTVYVWTKDAACNISGAGSDTIVLDTVGPAAPTDLLLDAGAASTANTAVSLDSLSGPADVAAWFVSESSSAPAAGAAGWSVAKPTSYTFATATAELKTVCVHVKDAANNVQPTGVCDSITKN